MKMCRRRHSVEGCIKDAKKYKTKKEWREKSATYYSAALRFGVLSLCTGHMNMLSKWTLENCRSESSKFSTKKEWFEKHPASYLGARRNGLMKECTGHMEKNGNNMLQKEDCLKAAALYTSEIEWESNDKFSYDKAKRAGWLAYCSSHYRYSETSDGKILFDEIRESSALGRDVVELCRADKSNYETKIEWALRSPALFKLAYFHGAVDSVVNGCVGG